MESSDPNIFKVAVNRVYSIKRWNELLSKDTYYESIQIGDCVYDDSLFSIIIDKKDNDIMYASVAFTDVKLGNEIINAIEYNSLIKGDSNKTMLIHYVKESRGSLITGFSFAYKETLIQPKQTIITSAQYEKLSNYGVF